MLLGHASMQTTTVPGTNQDLAHTPSDGIKLRVAGVSVTIFTDAVETAFQGRIQKWYSSAILPVGAATTRDVSPS